jgi:sortase (surface protein transpeptidase)
MRAARFPLYLITLALILALDGCSLTPTPGSGALHSSSPPATSTPSIVTPAIVPSRPKPIPVRLLIPHIGLNASVESLGILPNGDLARNPWEDVGWYDAGPLPGQRGSAVIDGHLDRPGGYPAIFWRLRDLQVGNNVWVITANGTRLHFRVTRIAFYLPQEAPIQDIFGNTGGKYLNLITCAGDWIPSEHQTTLRLVVYTTLV